MKMSGEEIIAAPIESVWAALNDPKILQACIPGCEKIEQSSPTDFSARVVIKLGPIKAGFNGTVKLSNLNAPHGYRISGKGEGGIAGFAEGGADVNLETVPEGTKLTYDVDAKIGGKMAMLGSRLIDSTAQQMAGQFFEKFAALAAKMKTVESKAPKKVAAKKAVKKPAAKKAAAKKPAAKKPAAKKAVKKAAPKKVAKKAVAKKPAKKASKKK